MASVLIRKPERIFDDYLMIINSDTMICWQTNRRKFYAQMFRICWVLFLSWRKTFRKCRIDANWSETVDSTSNSPVSSWIDTKQKSYGWFHVKTQFSTNCAKPHRSNCKIDDRSKTICTHTNESIYLTLNANTIVWIFQEFYFFFSTILSDPHRILLNT